MGTVSQFEGTARIWDRARNTGAEPVVSTTSEEGCLPPTYASESG